MRTYQAQFGVGDPVRIVQLERCPAVVTSINFGSNGPTYEVAWFHNGERKTAFVYGYELEPVGGNDQTQP